VNLLNAKKRSQKKGSVGTPKKDQTRMGGRKTQVLDKEAGGHGQRKTSKLPRGRREVTRGQNKPPFQATSITKNSTRDWRHTNPLY